MGKNTERLPSNDQKEQKICNFCAETGREAEKMTVGEGTLIGWQRFINCR